MEANPCKQGKSSAAVLELKVMRPTTHTIKLAIIVCFLMTLLAHACSNALNSVPRKVWSGLLRKLRPNTVSDINSRVVLLIRPAKSELQRSDEPICLVLTEH